MLYEVILVDGNSTDGTVEVARRLRPDIKHRPPGRPRQGRRAAQPASKAATRRHRRPHGRRRLDRSGRDPRFVDTLLDGADYAKGSRFMQRRPNGRHHATAPGRQLELRRPGQRALRQPKFTDITYGYNAMWRRAPRAAGARDRRLGERDRGNIRAHRRGLRIVEVPSVEAPRVAGEAKLRTFSAGWTILKAIIGERFKALPQVGSIAARGYGAVDQHGAGALVPVFVERRRVAVPVAFDRWQAVPAFVERRRVAVPVAFDRRQAVPGIRLQRVRPGRRGGRLGRLRELIARGRSAAKRSFRPD